MERVVIRKMEGIWHNRKSMDFGVRSRPESERPLPCSSTHCQWRSSFPINLQRQKKYLVPRSTHEHERVKLYKDESEELGIFCFQKKRRDDHLLSRFTRNSCINGRYKQKKEMERRLSALKSAVESGQADDERVREYYLLHLRRWIGISLEEIESIDQELKILREKDSSKEASTSHSSRQDRPPMKPFILTRDMAQAKVFGAGYPSLATMTVNDWYDQRRKYGALPDHGIAKTTPAEFKKAAQQQEDQEQKEEEDDEKALHRAREWDDWKDTHPRGYGNRQNMG
ncbi:immunoglobulin-binding protein 1 isoform X4 [Elephas maximus indicus]|uniref:immunoglobulin-binding protein 1 isoform X4 n=1 Tax=Elephas maximus indicus TaxID=99487 RepID=UPI00211711CC|nr:immunoglobulin-binding protein 1 isoform X4 [Elephas maximus indicus]